VMFSIITVAYNSASTISETLDSVGSQNYSSFEHIVIDGASSDETLALVRGHWNPSIKIISESDNGIYDAMNKGLACSGGDVIGFLNSDDLYADSEVLTRIGRIFRENPSVEACFGDLIYVSKDNLKVVRLWKSSPFK
jgi:glycosyltransferase involved in cell wall biosynthesis